MVLGGASDILMLIYNDDWYINDRLPFYSNKYPTNNWQFNKIDFVFELLRVK